ncbi:hypothetical protein BHE74_00008786 [Ensete ventricosum]|nr:hypothetical protein BHE74_00008786 [Ensete ventricosum]
MNEKLKMDLDEPCRRLDALYQELNDTRYLLVDANKQVSYEYRYRVALARLWAWYPGLEIEEDPFTIWPEDDSVPVENEQPFDDSIPP